MWQRCTRIFRYSYAFFEGNYNHWDSMSMLLPIPFFTRASTIVSCDLEYISSLSLGSSTGTSHISEAVPTFQRQTSATGRAFTILSSNKTTLATRNVSRKMLTSSFEGKPHRAAVRVARWQLFLVGSGEQD